MMTPQPTSSTATKTPVASSRSRRRMPLRRRALRPRRPSPKSRKGERPPAAHGATLRVIPVGGNEEIGGRNCYLIQYGQNILIVDIGLQWPDESMLGIDYVIPDLSYLKGKEKWIRGVIITHGHYDHTGGVPHWIPKLGNPEIFASDLTAAMLRKKMEDVAPDKKLRITVARSRDIFPLKPFRLQFFSLSHNIPGSLGVVVDTPLGAVVHTGDFKLDLRAHHTNRTDFQFVKSLAMRRVLCLMCDSTNASSPGHQLSEEEIEQNIHRMFTQTNGRIIFATFASLLSRIQQILTLAEKYNRKVLIEGFSMRTNIDIGKQLGYIRVRPRTILPWKEIARLPDNRVVVLCTGAQGEDKAVLMRIAHREHRYLRVQRGDLVVFSSSVIPGNERAVARLKDVLLREGAGIIDVNILDIHAGGHAKQEDIADFVGHVRPRYFMPIEGNYTSLLENKKVALRTGIPEKNILIADNGQVVEFSDSEGYVTNHRIPIEPVYVDGSGVGDVKEAVLRERRAMGEEGIFVIISTVDRRTGKVRGEPHVVSRGFVFVRDSGFLLSEARRHTIALIEQNAKAHRGDWAATRELIRENLEKLFFAKTQRQPMVLPVIIEA